MLASISGINFYALTFNPALAQPSGSAGGYLIDLNQFPFKYFQVQYVNSSGSGTLNVYAFEKDLTNGGPHLFGLHREEAAAAGLLL